jgi:MtN3 and saliva related transmembrane protein
MTDYATVVGGIAAVLSTVSFVPQATKIIRGRDTSGISTGMYLVTVAGFTLWTAYGVMRAAWPLIASNSICLILSAFILAMKLLPQRDKETVADAMDVKKGEDEQGKSRGTSRRHSRAGGNPG